MFQYVIQRVIQLETNRERVIHRVSISIQRIHSESPLSISIRCLYSVSPLNVSIQTSKRLIGSRSKPLKFLNDLGKEKKSNSVANQNLVKQENCTREFHERGLFKLAGKQEFRECSVENAL